MTKEILLRIGTVREIENEDSYHKDLRTNENVDDNYGGLRIRVELQGDDVIENNGIKDYTRLPWCFPLLPKTFQSIPKRGEAVLVLVADLGNPQDSQRYYIGPLISQQQYNTFCPKRKGTSLLKKADENPLGAINKNSYTTGAFPKSTDVAIIGRGKEDIILRYGEDNSSEIELRAGIRGEPTNDPDPNMVGNIIFNDADPAYIQLKYKQGLCGNPQANSIVNIVADKINLISNKDNNVATDVHDKNGLIKDERLSDITYSLQAVPLGNNLYDLLVILKECILHHVHPWAGMEQCGDWGGYTKKLLEFDLSSILSKHVRTS